MVALAFVTYNFGLTMVVNAFGPALLVLQRELGASRAGVSMAFAVLMLSMGVLAPVIGNLTRWAKLRTLMMTGATINAVGFLLLAFARNLTEVLLLYALVVGAGVCLMAIISAPTLISRWFEHDRGKAFAVGQLQVIGLVTAPLAGWLAAVGGRSLLFFSLAGLFLVLIPVMGLAIDRPGAVGQSPRRAPAAAASSAATESLRTSAEIFTDRRFWLLNLAFGIFTAAGITLASHGPAMAAARGASITLASTVLSACGAGTLLGALGFGWLIDRIGPLRALIGALIFTAALWLIFSQVSALPLMVVLAFFMGAGMGPAVALQSACINEIFGAANFSRVVGYSYFVKMPFLVGPAPLAGLLYDHSGGYGSTFAVVVAGTTVAVLLAIVLSVDCRRRSAPGQS
jgi:MFS family permease